MHKQIICILALLLAASSPAIAAPVIDVGTHYLLPGSVKTIAIGVSGGDLVEGLNFYVQVGDGGSANSGYDTKPTITGIDIIGSGTLFSQSNRGSEQASLGGLIWSDWTITQIDSITNTGVKLAATGTLAYVTINTADTTSGDSYSLSLTNVADKYFYPYSYNTNFGDVTPTITNGQIVIVDLHDMVWNKLADGVWTEHTWTNNTITPYPNYTANAFVNTAYTVSVNDAQEANTLTLSGGGKVSIGSAGSLAVTGAVNINLGGTLAIVAGAGLSASGINLSGGTISGSGTVMPVVTLAGGTLDAPNASDTLLILNGLTGTGGMTKSGPGTVAIIGDATYDGDTNISGGLLQLEGGLHSGHTLGAFDSLHAISGAGSLSVGVWLGSDVMLTADSISVNTLTIGAGSTVIIRALPGGPTAGDGGIVGVPEPSVAVLLIAAAVGLLLGCRRRIGW